MKIYSTGTGRYRYDLFKPGRILQEKIKNVYGLFFLKFRTESNVNLFQEFIKLRDSRSQNRYQEAGCTVVNPAACPLITSLSTRRMLCCVSGTLWLGRCAWLSAPRVASWSGHRRGWLYTWPGIMRYLYRYHNARTGILTTVGTTWRLVKAI
jgi:hypothetical protein